ncbi:MAG: hypothetical protein IJ741_04030, partial [Schwartzia sp.]|nr:hypothetical protein [Schwartzia sp. (in: firmicutes)]
PPAPPAAPALADTPPADENGLRDGLLSDYLAQIEKEKGTASAPKAAPAESGGKDGLLADYLAQIEKEKSEAPAEESANSPLKAWEK